MEIRILKPEEYPLLDSVPQPDSVKLDPANTWVAGAFDGEKLVGRLVALSLPHLEAAWIDPQYRDGLTAARLEKAMIEKLKELGAGCVIAFAVNERIESYLARLSYEKLATAWRKEI